MEPQKSKVQKLYDALTIGQFKDLSAYMKSAIVIGCKLTSKELDQLYCLLTNSTDSKLFGSKENKQKIFKQHFMYNMHAKKLI